MAFLYPEFDENGVKKICTIGGRNGDMLMDIRVIRMKAGTRRRFMKKDKEICVLLTEGEVVFPAARSARGRQGATSIPICP